jgi:hypothetical protein
MNKPTKEEINVDNSLDEIVASEHFFGLDLKEAETLFINDSLNYQWDLLWMGPKAFNYYIKSAINYLKRDESCGDVDFIDALYQIIEIRLKRDELELSRLDLIDLIDYVVNTYQKFEVEEKIYGNLKKKYSEIGNLLKI